MRASTDFTPVVVVLPSLYEGTSAGLSGLGVPHLEFADLEPGEGLKLLKLLKPDVLFSLNAHNADSIPPEYFVEELITFTRVVYTDYSIGIIDDRGIKKPTIVDETTIDSIWADYDQGFHRKAWMLCCANEEQKRIYETTRHRGANAVVTGYPKLDRLVQRGREKQSWPIKGSHRKFRLIWAPHHTLPGGWLGFGMFPHVCMDVLKWATNDPEIEIVLKPHPLICRNPRPDLDYFLKPWHALENTAIQTGGDYGPLMAASDAMLTDGISWLAEYQVFNKPLIWLDSGRHPPFNTLGKHIIEGAYPVRCINEAFAIVVEYNRGNDPREPQRRESTRFLMPFPGASAEHVLAAIRARLRP